MLLDEYYRADWLRDVWIALRNGARADPAMGRACDDEGQEAAKRPGFAHQL